MGVRVLVIPVLVWAFLFAGAPDAREAAPCDPPARVCSNCSPPDSDGRIDASAPCAFRCCCAPDRAPEPGPTRSRVRADGHPIVLGMPIPAERATVLPLMGTVARVEATRLPARPSGRVLLAIHCVWQT